MPPIENLNDGNVAGSQPQLWQGENHPLTGVNPGDNLVRAAVGEPQYLEVPVSTAGRVEAPSEIPAPVQQAIETGTPIRFSSAGENADAGREPDFYLTSEGKLVANPKATPSPDGGINIEIQTQDAENNKSLTDAIIHQTEMQKKAAEEMIRLFQKAHPGQPVPSWMENLANAEPNLPNFVPFPPRPQEPVTPPPENGFVNRGVSPGGGGRSGGSGGASGFAGNGGFDSQGYFKGNGSKGDGTLNTGGSDSRGQPLGEGETVKAKDIYDYLTEKHNLSPEMASGILGNLQVESNFKTDAYNRGEDAIGLCQWRGGRKVALENFAADQGKPVTDWRVQIDFMMHELKTSESGAWAKIQQAESPGQVAAAFDKYFERSDGSARGTRMANAENIYQKFTSAAMA